MSEHKKKKSIDKSVKAYQVRKLKCHEQELMTSLQIQGCEIALHLNLEFNLLLLHNNSEKHTIRTSSNFLILTIIFYIYIYYLKIEKIKISLHKKNTMKWREHEIRKYKNMHNF